MAGDALVNAQPLVTRAAGRSAQTLLLKLHGLKAMLLSACTSGPTELWGTWGFMFLLSVSQGLLTYSFILLLFCNLKEVTSANHDLCVRKAVILILDFPLFSGFFVFTAFCVASGVGLIFSAKLSEISRHLITNFVHWAWLPQWPPGKWWCSVSEHPDVFCQEINRLLYYLFIYIYLSNLLLLCILYKQQKTWCCTSYQKGTSRNITTAKFFLKSAYLIFAVKLQHHILFVWGQ